MFTKNKIFIAVVCCALALSVGCKKQNKKSEVSAELTSQIDLLQEGDKTRYPFAITSYDHGGKPIEQIFTKTPERVVTTNISSTETLLELGLGDKIVGITRPENEMRGKWKEEIEKLNIIGNKLTLSKEIILGQKPDIIVSSSRGLTDAYHGSIETFNKIGINVFTQSASVVSHNPDLKSIIHDVRMLGQIFDIKPRAEEYARELEEKLASVEREISKREKGEKRALLTMMALDPNKKTFSSYGLSTGLPLAMLDQLHLKSATQTALHNNNYENLIEINPDIILYIKFDSDSGEAPIDILMKDPLLKNVSAIKHKRVFVVGYDDFLDYGARNFDTVIKLYHAIYDNS